jgi:hypothetical protein
MAVSTKRKRPIVVDGREYLWWVVPDYEPPFVPSAGTSLKVVDTVGNMCVEYHLGQPGDVCHVVVQGKRFGSLTGCGGPHRRFRCPVFASGPAVTPADVAALIRWCEAASEPTEVNYLGLPLSAR